MGWYDDDYRRKADYCFKQAGEVRFEDLRAEWLRLASLWLAMMRGKPHKDPNQESIAEAQLPAAACPGAVCHSDMGA